MLPGTGIARIVLIIVAVVVVLGLLLSTLSLQGAY
jgi:hypothetical protein